MTVLRLIWALVAVALLAAPAAAQTVERAPVPDWVQWLDTGPAATPDGTGAPVRVLLFDHQLRFDDDVTHAFSRSRSLIQSVQGLSIAGTVVGGWKPGAQTLRVHAINIIRGDQTIDVLASQDFAILRREQNLEAAMLDGVLTATLQPADLRVGDVLEVAFTQTNHDPVAGSHGEFLLGGQFGGPVERYHVRASWPAARGVRARAIAPWTLPASPRREGGDHVVEIDESPLLPLTLPTDAPARFLHVRQLELTDYRDWSEVSVLMSPLFERASTLEEGSPLQAEIDRIAAAWATPAERASAALRLVQDDIRYLALAMGEGSLIPASADATWRSRFGDCKAKTALLIALLRGLGIEAEPALVSTNFGDGLDQRLPMLGVFDHVLVRATLDGRVWWIDGTRQGDRTLAGVAVPPYRWSLPVRPGGAGLEPMPQPPLADPLISMNLAYDASAGLDAEARIEAEMTLVGETATVMQASFGSIPLEQRDEGLRGVWAGAAPGMEIESVDGIYDADTAQFRITMSGKGRLQWSEASGPGRAFEVPNSIATMGVSEARAAGPYEDLPYVVVHPNFIRSVVTVRLPAGGAGFTMDGEDVALEVGGHSLERTSRIDDGVATMALSIRSLVSEITAAETAAARTQAAALDDTPVRIRAPLAYRATDGDAAGLSAETDDIDTLIERGRVFLSRGDLEGALAAFNRAIELAPEDAEALANRGGLYRRMGDLPRARADLDRAIELDPDSVPAETLGGLAVQEGRFEDAVIEYSVALRLDRSNIGALLGRAWAYRRLGRLDRTLADHRAVQALNPDDAGARELVLATLVEMGQVAEAETGIAAALAANPADIGALTVKVDIETGRGAPAAALPALDAGVEAAPDDEALRLLRAELRTATGDLDAAAADLAHVRDQHASDPEMLNNLCWTQATAGFALDQALADCDAALALLPGRAALIDSRALVLLQLGRLEEARAAYDEALRLAPTQTASLYGRGLVRQAMGDAGGEADLAAALAQDPDAAEDFKAWIARRDAAPAMAAE